MEMGGGDKSHAAYRQKGGLMHFVTTNTPYPTVTLTTKSGDSALLMFHCNTLATVKVRDVHIVYYQYILEARVSNESLRRAINDTFPLLEAKFAENHGSVFVAYTEPEMDEMLIALIGMDIAAWGLFRP